MCMCVCVFVCAPARLSVRACVCVCVEGYRKRRLCMCPPDTLHKEIFNASNLDSAQPRKGNYPETRLVIVATPKIVSKSDTSL